VRVVSKQSLLTLATSALLAMLPVVAEAQQMTQPGVEALGISNWGYFPCTDNACQPTGGLMSQTQTGGAGFTNASTSFIGAAPGANEAPFLNYLASAQLQGLLGTAQLRTLAQSVVMTGTPPGYTGLCCYYYDVNALATALQWYSFTGTQPETFTISYTIDAILKGVVDPQTGLDTRGSANTSGGLSIFDGVVDPALALELPLGTNLDLSQVFLDGTMGDANGFVTGGGSVTFTLNPGSGFFMSSFLSSSVPQQVPGTILADASHTMNTMFTAGNTSLLQAQLRGVPMAVVPEPSTYALMSAGLAAMGLVARRRRRTSPA
jgi:PEP-CTERM motif